MRIQIQLLVVNKIDEVSVFNEMKEDNAIIDR